MARRFNIELEIRVEENTVDEALVASFVRQQFETDITFAVDLDKLTIIGRTEYDISEIPDVAP